MVQFGAIWCNFGWLTLGNGKRLGVGRSVASGGRVRANRRSLHWAQGCWIGLIWFNLGSATLVRSGTEGIESAGRWQKRRWDGGVSGRIVHRVGGFVFLVGFTGI